MCKASIRTLSSVALVLASVTAAAAQTAPQDVTLKAPDGVALKATYYGAGKPGPGILLLHQCNRDRKEWTNLATRAAAKGFHVLALDYRGYGESEGDRFENFQQQGPVMAEKWPGDVDAAFDWLVSRPGVERNRIGAAGASCGVNQSAQLARRHPEVKTIVLLSGGVNPDAREYIRQSPWLPVLAAASLDDGNAASSMRWIAGWSRNPKTKYVEYKAAGHGTDMFAVEKGLEPLMLEWFETNLRNAPTTPPATSTPQKPTVVEEFWTALTQPGGVPKARQMYDEARKKDPNVVLFPEGEANQFGYQLLQEGKTKDAIEVFRLNVDAYPTSANTYDSLSDGYLADGNTTEALRYAEKAIAVLAKDTQVPDELRAAIRDSAEKKIRDLKK
jgi:dienelactone hydrolase